MLEIPCDLSRLSDVRAAALSVRDLLGTGAVRPLRGLVANAGVSPHRARTHDHHVIHVDLRR